MTHPALSRRIVGHITSCLAFIGAAGVCLTAAAQSGVQAQHRIDRAPAPVAKQQLRQEAAPPPAAGAGQERGIIIVSGKPGSTVTLNPQPLPPKSQKNQMRSR